MPHLVQSAHSATLRLSFFHGRRWLGRRTPRLDVEALPDHLKRDLGLLGGRASPARDILRD